MAISPKLFKRLFFRINIRSNLQHIGKLDLRKQIYSSAIYFTKSEAAKTNSTQNIRRLFSLAKPEKFQLAAAVGLLVISSSVTMSIPFAMGKVIDMIYKIDQFKLNNEPVKSNENIVEILTPDDKKHIMNKLQNVCGALVGVFILGSLANFGRVYLMRMISQRIAARMRNSLYSSIGNNQKLRNLCL